MFNTARCYQCIQIYTTVLTTIKTIKECFAKYFDDWTGFEIHASAHSHTHTHTHTHSFTHIHSKMFKGFLCDFFTDAKQLIVTPRAGYQNSTLIIKPK